MVIEAEFGHHPAAIVLRDDIGREAQLSGQTASLFEREVERDASPPPRLGVEGEPLVGVAQAGEAEVVHLSGGLDLDYLGAEFAQHPDALRDNGGDTELDDPYPGEWERRCSTAGGGERPAVMIARRAEAR